MIVRYIVSLNLELHGTVRGTRYFERRPFILLLAKPATPINPVPRSNIEVGSGIS